MIKSAVVICILCIFCCIDIQALALPCTRLSEASNHEIQLSGKVTKEKHFGPPNFGQDPETDSSFTAWVIKLDYDIAIIPEGSQQASSINKILVSKVQLFYFKDDTLSTLSSFDGSHVIVYGTLRISSSGGQVTPLFLQVKRVVRTENINNQCLVFLVK